MGTNAYRNLTEKAMTWTHKKGGFPYKTVSSESDVRNCNVRYIHYIFSARTRFQIEKNESAWITQNWDVQTHSTHFHCSIFSRKVRRKWQNATRWHDSGPDSGYALLKPIMRVVAIWLEFCNVKGSKTMVIKNRIRNLRECKKQFKHLQENSRCYGV